MTATITATYHGGQAVNGKVHFIPSVRVIGADGIYLKDRYTFDVVNGVLSATIPDTDSGNPAGWTYKVFEDFRGGSSYFIFAPAGTHDLKDLQTVESDGTYVTLAGPKGDQGPTGTRGSRWYVSQDPIWDPVNVTDMQASDMFLYPTSGDIFQYNGTDWTFVGNIRTV